MSFKKGHKINLGKKRPDLLKLICINGHDVSICGRSGKGCTKCLEENYIKNREILRLYDQQYYIKNKVKRQEQKRKWNKNNKEKVRLYVNAHKDIYRLASFNKDINRKLRVPKFGQDGIVEFYKNCPKGKVIDHVIPLQGKLVSGLHVIWNLQYLTPEENWEKSSNINLLTISEKYSRIIKITQGDLNA